MQAPSTLVVDPRVAHAFDDLYLSYFGEYVYNHVPQFLLRVQDMKLVDRDTLCHDFRARAYKRAKALIMAGETSVASIKKDIKHLLNFAILSHRWEDSEPTFKDMSNTTRKADRKGPGFDKLRRFCQVARADYHCEYVWSDTCCINKESSAVFDEAIRSMFHWYENAYITIVYLAQSSKFSDFRQEPWFTRGWTLQELLASGRIRIYGKDWTPLCPRTEEGRDEDFPHPNDKRNDSLLEAISAVTGIRGDNIRSFNPSGISVAEKMNWASKRMTTRIEDVAYSLLGIFDVSISIAYGEGDRAFQRLLEAIAQRSQDLSLLAWSGPPSRYSHAFPSSPASYRTIAVDATGGDPTFTVQKRGIHIKLLTIPVQVARKSENCTLEPCDAGLISTITIKGRFTSRLQTSSEDQYAIGVVNYDLPSNRDDVGQLRAAGRKHYFGMILEISQQLEHGLWLCKRKEEADALLTMVGSANVYEAELRTVCLLH